MTHENRVLGVFKFAARNHIEQFVQGVLYMNTLQHFVKIETGSLRMDSNEGTSHVLRGDGAILKMTLTADDEYKPVAEIRGPIRYKPDDLRTVNLFCMYALASDALVDERNWGFGDTFALLIDFDKFMKRVKAAAQGMGQELRYQLVEYIDELSYEGPVGVFKKLSGFSYQSEFRIALFPGTGAALRFDVGNLSDNVIVGPLADLNDRLKVQVNEQRRRQLLIKNEVIPSRSRQTE
jgi:hypothetical protein